MANKLELTWIGKEKRIDVEPRILIEDPQKSHHSQGGLLNSGIQDNLLIHGDNLLALKALEAKYAGQVKCIYIDPPYNTGSAFEHYDDNLEHSQWLNLIKPRLEILRNLLSDNGSIWISIDDEEVHYLKVLCDEIFGRNNFVTSLVWQQRTTRENRKVFSANCEYLLLYAKKLLSFENTRNMLPLTEEILTRYKNPDNDPRGPWQSVSINAQGGHGTPSQFYDLVAPNGKIHKLPNGRCWLYTKDKLQEEISHNNIWFGKDGNGAPRKKMFLSNVTTGITPETLWLADFAGTNDMAKKETKSLFNLVETFETPKPELLIHRILSIASNPGDLVLDSFLGSGTTAAVAHKMGRRWIGIEMGEHAYTHCKVRMDKVIDGTDQGGITKAVKWQGGGGYTFYELAPSLINCDSFGEPVINKAYNADQLAAAVALHEGFTYQPDKECFWKQSTGNEKSYLFVTTAHITAQYLDSIRSTMKDGEFLIIASKSFDQGVERAYREIAVKKIPQMLLDRCEFGVPDYNLNIVHPPVYQDEEEEEGNE